MADEQPYQSLYRRFRPQRFEEVRGQDHVTRALRNAVREGRVAHAYLFSGPRGTGKTSTARILAMALNCEHQQDGEPDGECASCVEIRRGASMDVHELDAASNRGLDEMRELLSRVALGTTGRWKVYIVDEVHQLTPAASSALLKTLEEPPAHVVFVLATTDPQKVLQTIRSRTQHYEFRLLGSEVLGGLLREVNDHAHLGVPPEAIDLVVRRGQGSARDALSALDQVAALGEVEDEATALGGIVDALAERDAGRVLTTVAEAVAAGRDPRRLVTDLIGHLRNGFLATQARSLVLLPDDAAAEVERQANQLGLPGVVRALEVLGQAAVDMRDAPDPRVTLEVALVRLAAPAADSRTGAGGGLAQRVERLEREVAQLARGAGAGPSAAGPSLAPTVPAAAPAGPPGVQAGPPGASAGPATTPAGPPATPATPAGSRPALGALRRPPSGPGPSSRPAPPPAPPPGRESSLAERSGGSSGPSPAPPEPAGGPPPSRDELTKAWGDHVLPALPARVKVYFALGRFVESGGGRARLALPDQGLLARAGPLREEVEAALGAHFGRRVPLELVVDAKGEGAPPSAAPPPPDDPSAYDLDDLEDAGPGVVSPEQRLLQAFPGAEEVTS
ncbi:MAG TPA: DNA polymerase III subunit gamma/tau [Acidimicrobiales bacterium]|nr:DNA polymerase III subunit gamma/tau [Acidimicrobiales bacterium]